MGLQKSAKLAAVALAAAALVLFALVRAAWRRRARRYLEGMWVANPQFLSEAGLKDFRLLVLPPGEDDEADYVGYAVMVRGPAAGPREASDFLVNSRVRLDVDALSAAAAGDGAKLDVRLGFDAEQTALPEAVVLTLSLTAGTLTMVAADGEEADGTLLGFFHKDMLQSSALKDA